MPLQSQIATRWAITFAYLTSFANGMVLAQDTPSDTTLRVLFLGDRGHHAPRERFDILQPVLAERGIAMSYTESLGDLRLDTLQQYAALVLYANIDTIDAEAEQGLLDYVRSGGGFVPIHCASYCFRNSPQVVAMIGAQFQRHGTGVFRTEAADTQHPIMRGFGGFESWDETYVHHRHNEADRTVLDYRIDENGREPWTWVRSEGEGRVFYTAWGHDARTWSHPGFANLIERGILWVAGKDPAIAGDFTTDRSFPLPRMTSLPDGSKPFIYDDVGKKIPNYTPSAQWGVQGEPFNLMQQPLPPEESIRRFVTPIGFHVELFAAEPDIQGKPISMNWDERGRLWICETVDYPNELAPRNAGRDRIRICEDTNGDGRADRFTLFADGLSIPATLTFHRGGVIVQNGTETLYLRDDDGDDVADRREVWYRGWNQQDTHGGVSNFQYGLDNWIWAMQGYNPSRPRAGDRQFDTFRQGFFRFHPETRDIEYLRSTDNNTWGIGISEEGFVFGSTANRNPSVFLPIPNRYYERVAGWRPSLVLRSIADTHLFRAITDRVRQVDQHGGYTAAAGHALYTARSYPREYWNQAAFVNDPTGHLVGTFLLKSDGAGFRSSNPFNLLASDDEWSAPIMAEVGPDGQVWVIDWYNYIVQHNPTPQGFETGRGAAYETDLRDKKHGRIYRVVYDAAPPAPRMTLAGADAETLVRALSHPTMLWRKHAQRLLVERGNSDVVPLLLQLVNDPSVDEIGLNVGAIHALWTLHGLQAIVPDRPDILAAVYSALGHRSAGVRRNALQVAPPTAESVAAIVERRLVLDVDAQVRLQAFLTLADLPASDLATQAIVMGMRSPRNSRDPWIRDAATCAAANQGADGLRTIAAVSDLPAEWRMSITVVAEHVARRYADEPFDVGELLAALGQGDAESAIAVIRGLNAGWQPTATVENSAAIDDALEQLVQHIPLGERALVLQLADRWGSRRLDGYARNITDNLFRELDDTQRSEADRIDAARRLVQFRPADRDSASAILSRIQPQTEPNLAVGLVAALGAAQLDDLGALILTEWENWSPLVRRQSIETLLSRRLWAESLVGALDRGELQVSDLTLEQRTALANHPDARLRDQAVAIFARGGAMPNADRQAVLEEYLAAAHSTGDAARGKLVFTESCAKCHRHSGEGHDIGPELTGMAVHPKEELLVHILDPNRSVESNFRMYHVQTIDGLTLSGMLVSESRTSIELVNSQGERKTVLREEIEDLRGSRLSVMPEGIEKELTVAQMTDLLEYLTQRGAWLTLDLSKVATVASDRGMFYDRNADLERLVFTDWGAKEFRGIPFQLIDPQQGERPNAIVLRGPRNSLTGALPRRVELPVNAPARAIHVLGGVGGWAFPYSQEKTVSLIVRIHYADGEQEDHELRNGEHCADYIRRVDVPQSEFAFALRGQQLRYLAIIPARSESIAKLELVKGPDQTAPVVMAITVETR